jgi:hypothetical protein
MADIFISYANEDRDRIAPIVKALEELRYSVFWDWRSMPVGKTWRQYINEGLETADCVVVLWSTKSIQSEWVIEEADHGKEKGILVPVRLDEVRAPFRFRQIQAANLIGWNGGLHHPEYLKLLKAIESIAGVPTTDQMRQNVGQPNDPAEQKTMKAPRSGCELVWIPGGEFLMGSPDAEDWRNERDGPQHLVRVPGFNMGRYPVTNKAYGRFLDENLKAIEPEFWSRMTGTKILWAHRMTGVLGLMRSGAGVKLSAAAAGTTSPIAASRLSLLV